MASVVMSMDSVYENSVLAIESLQSRFPQHRDFFFMISNVFDPRYAFLIYAPLLYSFDRAAGKKLMWVSVLAEWSNQVLKWMLHGERPYWWVHETGVYNRTGTAFPTMKQYSMTCETGPGSPSGHSMVSAAVWYVLIEAILKNSGHLNKSSKSLMASVCWCTYAFLVFCVSVSRVYIAAHFPHQCLLGIIIGFTFAMNMSKIMSVLDKMNLRHYILATAGLLASALLTFASLRAMGFNPMWSVDRAVKWCARQEYIHMDTTPFFSMMRYAGFLLGMGIAFNSFLYQRVSKINLTTGMKIFAAIACVLVSKISERIDLPKSNTAVFYGLAFVENAVLPYLFICVIPYIMTKLWSTKEVAVQKKVN